MLLNEAINNYDDYRNIHVREGLDEIQDSIRRLRFFYRRMGSMTTKGTSIHEEEVQVQDIIRKVSDDIQKIFDIGTEDIDTNNSDIF